MARLHTPDQFKKPLPLALMGLVGLVLTFLLILRALDTGSYWQYLGVVILVTLSIRLVKRAVRARK